VPAFDLGSEPEPWPTATEVNHRPRHVGITRLVLADGVSVGETEDLGYIVGVDEVIHEDSSGHNKRAYWS